MLEFIRDKFAKWDRFECEEFLEPSTEEKKKEEKEEEVEEEEEET